MKLLVISDLNDRAGSGYTSITQGFMAELGHRGHEILLLGFNHSGLEHPFNARVVPTDPGLIRSQVVAALSGFRPDAVIVILDIPWQHKLRYLQTVVPYIGVFPIESDPLVHPSDFTMTIDTMDGVLCESRFGTQLLLDAGIRAQFLPIPVDTTHWRPPTFAERTAARTQLGVEERFVVVTVADNQERKNLPVHYASVALLAGHTIEWPPGSGAILQRAGKRGLSVIKGRKIVPETYYILNTKEHNTAMIAMAITWNQAALTDHFGISDRCLVMNHPEARGLSQEQLRNLYWAGDAFLLLSKAEGLGLPVLEAMACGLPVVGSGWTGVAESLDHGRRGQMVPAEYSQIDPFHNQLRRWADPLLAAEALYRVHQGGALIERQVAAGLDHVRSMNWVTSMDIFEEVLRDAVTKRAPAGATPVSQEEPASARRD